MTKRCVIFCFSEIHLFFNFNQVKKNQLLLNEAVNITDAKKESLLKLVGYEGRRQNIFCM